MNAPPVAGRLIDGRYRVGAALARGGMSTVYSGTDTRLDRPVAVKIMDPRQADDPAFRARVEREARAAARIDHPNVVDVFDHGVDTAPPGDSVVFLVMELVEGGTLRDVLRNRGAVGVPAALAVMEQVLAGLTEAHRLGMVHRDVKPENVLIGWNRELKVADFGLVAAGAQAGASHAGMIMGTMAYLSPEQVATGKADSRSDVYSAGILLYELLTGAPPFAGDTALSVAYQHVNSTVPAPSLIAGDVPPELDDLVLRATDRDPARRPADAAEMLAQLRRVAVMLEVPRVPIPVPPLRPLAEQATIPGGPAPRHTRALPMPPVGAPAHHTRVGPLDQPMTGRDEPPAHVRMRRRSRRLLAFWIAFFLVVATIVAVSAWWLGSGRWTAMPALVGVDQSAAEKLLADADLVPTFEKHLDDSVPAGQVAATVPASQARLLRGSTVTVTVSSGRPTVPAIAAGTSVADAEQAVRAAGLTPVRNTSADQESDSVPEGAVIATKPAAGTALPSGGSVTLVVSSGAAPKVVEVPRVVGDTFDDAERQLTELGLKVEKNDRSFFFSSNRVVRQDPNPGAEVAPGSTVTLDVV